MRIFRNFRFKTKIILVCVIILLLNSVISGGLYYNYAFKDTLKNYYSSSEDMVTQMRVQLSNETQSITSRLYAAFSNQSFYNPMDQYLQDQESVNQAVLLGNVANVILEFRQGDRYIHSVSIETELRGFDDFTMIRNRDFSFFESSIYEALEKKGPAAIHWFSARKSSIFKTSETVIPVVYRFRINYRPVCVVVNLSQREINNILKETYHSYDLIFIADGENQNILNCSQETDQILEKFSKEEAGGGKSVCKEVSMNGKKYLATYTVMNGTGWQICALKSTESLVGNLGKLRYFIVLVVCICTLVSIMLIVLLAHSMTVPLGQLSQIMNEVTRTEDFRSQFDYPYDDEVGKLSTSFNYMIQKINHLVSELNANIEALKEEKENVKRVQAQKRKAELKALQAQINPHFLYNTLNTITWQAADQGAKEISILSNSLGKFFRISLSKGKEVITLREELEHVSSYLQIQRVRYREKINYEFQVPEDVKDLYIIKLVLQPLVENSIYHGIKLKEEPGHIRISIERQMSGAGIPTLQIRVEDDGEGIEADRLALIRQRLASEYVSQDAGQDAGYGIYNVNERIRLFYGDGYGLDLESQYQKGTRAVIVIPIQTTEEGR